MEGKFAHKSSKEVRVYGGGDSSVRDFSTAMEYYVGIRRILEELGIILENAKVLEVGSGNGVLVDYFKKKGVDVAGLDVMPHGDKKFPQVAGLIENMPFRDNSFNVVFSVGAVFDNSIYNQDQNLMMQEIYRVLESGGVYVASNFREIKTQPIKGFRKVSHLSKSMWKVYKKS